MKIVSYSPLHDSVSYPPLSEEVVPFLIDHQTRGSP